MWDCPVLPVRVSARLVDNGGGGGGQKDIEGGKGGGGGAVMLTAENKQQNILIRSGGVTVVKIIKMLQDRFFKSLFRRVFSANELKCGSSGQIFPPVF